MTFAGDVPSSERYRRLGMRLGAGRFAEGLHRDALVTHLEDLQLLRACPAREGSPIAGPDFIKRRASGDIQLMWLRSRSTSSRPTMRTTRSVPAALA